MTQCGCTDPSRNSKQDKDPSGIIALCHLNLALLGLVWVIHPGWVHSASDTLLSLGASHHTQPCRRHLPKLTPIENCQTGTGDNLYNIFRFLG